jgi:hypothetical protein
MLRHRIRTDQYKHSFFIQTAVDWNHLDENTVSAEKLESFKSAIATKSLSTRHFIAQQGSYDVTLQIQIHGNEFIKRLTEMLATKIFTYVCSFSVHTDCATKRGNVPTRRWSGKSAVFLMESALTSHGSSKSNKKPLDGRGISD